MFAGNIWPCSYWISVYNSPQIHFLAWAQIQFPWRAQIQILAAAPQYHHQRLVSSSKKNSSLFSRSSSLRWKIDSIYGCGINLNLNIEVKVQQQSALSLGSSWVKILNPPWCKEASANSPEITLTPYLYAASELNYFSGFVQKSPALVPDGNIPNRTV